MGPLRGELVKASERKRRVLQKFQAHRQTPLVESRRMHAFPSSSEGCRCKLDRPDTLISYNIVSQTGLPDVFGDYLPGRSSGLGHADHMFNSVPEAATAQTSCCVPPAWTTPRRCVCGWHQKPVTLVPSSQSTSLLSASLLVVNVDGRRRVCPPHPPHVLALPRAPHCGWLALVVL